VQQGLALAPLLHSLEVNLVALLLEGLIINPDEQLFLRQLGQGIG